MSKIALTHNHFDPAKLAAVIAEMQVLGAPSVKAVWMECWGMWAALEGCHRIRAAKELGLTPEIGEIEYSEDLTTADIGLADAFDGDVFNIAEIADEAYKNLVIDF